MTKTQPPAAPSSGLLPLSPPDFPMDETRPAMTQTVNPPRAASRPASPAARRALASAAAGRCTRLAASPACPLTSGAPCGQRRPGRAPGRSASETHTGPRQSRQAGGSKCFPATAAHRHGGNRHLDDAAVSSGAHLGQVDDRIAEIIGEQLAGFGLGGALRGCLQIAAPVVIAALDVGVVAGGRGGLRRPARSTGASDGAGGGGEGV